MTLVFSGRLLVLSVYFFLMGINLSLVNVFLMGINLSLVNVFFNGNQPKSC